jgi:hypothetical protein
VSYTIMEYDLLTGECATIGQSCGDDSGEAKARYIEKNNYQARKWVWLIARGPNR